MITTTTVKGDLFEAQFNNMSTMVFSSLKAASDYAIKHRITIYSTKQIQRASTTITKS